MTLLVLLVLGQTTTVTAVRNGVQLDGGRTLDVTCTNCSGGPSSSGGGWVPDGGYIGSVSVLHDGGVAITNWPGTQTVSGSVSVSNFPATQPVSGSVSVSNLVEDPHAAVGAFDAFGSTRVAQQANQVDVVFSRAAPASLVTVTTSGGGAAAQVGGLAQFSTSTAVTAAAKGVSATSTSYIGGAEVFAYFTAAFTTPTSAASYQRIGLYDTNNGVFVGYNGTSFQACYRDATVDTCTTKGAWSADQLTGAGGSRFTRNGTPEAIDLTKVNVFRIRFGWLGVAPIRWEVLSPDGAWVEFHRVRYPNTATTASIDSPDLPMTIDVSKTSSDATNVVMLTGCWAAGTTGVPAAPGGVKYVRQGGPGYWSCSLDAIAASLTQCQAAPAAGLRLYVTDITIGSTTATAGQFILRQGTGTNCGTGTASLFPAAATVARFAYPANTSASGSAKYSFATPLQLTTSNALCILCVATNTCTVSIQGYTAP